MIWIGYHVDSMGFGCERVSSVGILIPRIQKSFVLIVRLGKNSISIKKSELAFAVKRLQKVKDIALQLGNAHLIWHAETSVDDHAPSVKSTVLPA